MIEYQKLFSENAGKYLRTLVMAAPLALSLATYGTDFSYGANFGPAEYNLVLKNKKPKSRPRKPPVAPAAPIAPQDDADDTPEDTTPPAAPSALKPQPLSSNPEKSSGLLESYFMDLLKRNEITAWSRDVRVTYRPRDKDNNPTEYANFAKARYGIKRNDGAWIYLPTSNAVCKKLETIPTHALHLLCTPIPKTSTQEKIAKAIEPMLSLQAPLPDRVIFDKK